MRNRNILLVLVVAVIAAGCETSSCDQNSTAPSGSGSPTVPSPIDAPHSAIEFAFYRGDPTCTMGCSGPVPAVELVSERVDFGEQTTAVTTKVGATHLLKVRVRYPIIGGHTVKLWITNHTEEPVGIYSRLDAVPTGNGNYGIQSGVGFSTKNKPGTYPLEILVEESGGDLPETVTIRAVINITLE